MTTDHEELLKCAVDVADACSDEDAVDMIRDLAAALREAVRSLETAQAWRASLEEWLAQERAAHAATDASLTQCREAYLAECEAYLAECEAHRATKMELDRYG